jgi:hypothetical protein
MRESEPKSIMVSNFLLRAAAKRSWGEEGKAVYNPAATEVQQYQHGSHV